MTTKYILQLVASSMLLTCFTAWSAEHPDPSLLLKGVRTSRETLHGSGRMRIAIEKKQLGTIESSTIQLDIDFVGDKRRFVQERSIFYLNSPKPGEKISPREQFEKIGNDSKRAFEQKLGQLKTIKATGSIDGSQRFDLSDYSDVTVREVSKPGVALCFDPRILGISKFLSSDYSLDLVLDFSKAIEVKVLQQETVRGVLAWHIRVIPIEDLECHYWISDTEGFRVHRFEYLDRPSEPMKLNRTTVELFYGDASWTSPLPQKAVYTELGPKREEKRVYEWLSFDPTAIPSEAVFGLSGLNIPVGTMIVDERIHRVLGYWNGSRVVSDRSDAVQRAAIAESQENQPRSTNWPLVIGLTFGLLIAIVAVRRYFHRAKA